jgi:hypothetical protein
VIHTPEDGRGLRKVFVNGREVPGCFYADDKVGLARRYRYPLRLDRWKKRVLSRTVRGAVRVEQA